MRIPWIAHGCNRKAERQAALRRRDIVRFRDIVVAQNFLAGRDVDLGDVGICEAIVLLQVFQQIDRSAGRDVAASST
jgi:hypothetical protein